MLKGTVSSYNPRRGTGFVRPAHTETAVPFSTRDAQDGGLRHGDPVEFRIVGGMAGLMARGVRRLAEA